MRRCWSSRRARQRDLGVRGRLVVASFPTPASTSPAARATSPISTRQLSAGGAHPALPAQRARQPGLRPAQRCRSAGGAGGSPREGLRPPPVRTDIAACRYKAAVLRVPPRPSPPAACAAALTVEQEAMPIDRRTCRHGVCLRGARSELGAAGLSRREFVARGAALGGTALLAGPLAACGSSEARASPSWAAGWQA